MHSAHEKQSALYAVALMPGAPGEIREVRVIVDLFGAASLAEAIGGLAREVDANGVPYAGKDREWIVPVQRLVAARVGDDKRLLVSRSDLEEKRAAYAARLRDGEPRRLRISGRRPAALPAADAPERLSWIHEHERAQEAAA